MKLNFDKLSTELKAFIITIGIIFIATMYIVLVWWQPVIVLITLGLILFGILYMMVLDTLTDD